MSVPKNLVNQIHDVLLRHHQHIDEYINTAAGSRVRACHCGKPWSTRHQAEMVAEVVDP